MPTPTDALTQPDDTEEGPSAEELVQRYMERVTSQCHVSSNFIVRSSWNISALPSLHSKVKNVAKRRKIESITQKSLLKTSQLISLLFTTHYIVPVLTPKFTAAFSPLFPSLLSSPVTQTARLQGAEGVCYTAEALPWRSASERVLIKVEGSLWRAATLSHSWLVRGGEGKLRREEEGEEREGRGKEKRKGEAVAILTSWTI